MSFTSLYAHVGFLHKGINCLKTVSAYDTFVQKKEQAELTFKENHPNTIKIKPDIQIQVMPVKDPPHVDEIATRPDIQIQVTPA